MVGFYYFIAMDQFRVVCINDKFRPSEFPVNLWVKKGQIYTVSESVHLARQHMSIGYKFDEIKIPEDCKYQYFISNRFRPIDQDEEEAEKALEELILEIEEYA
jgi:hypothetical protein